MYVYSILHGGSSVFNVFDIVFWRGEMKFINGCRCMFCSERNVKNSKGKNTVSIKDKSAFSTF